MLAELSTLPSGVATTVARHLVAAGQLLHEDPETAYAHAVAARERGSRVAAVREAAGLAAYAAGRYAEAMPELRTAKRLTGLPDLLPVIADVERGLGRPERALELAVSPEADRLDAAGRIELRIVAAGARRDLGQLDAAVLTLQVPEALRSTRLAYAYADMLLSAGRRDEARDAFARAAALDTEGATDAAARLDELDGVDFIDVLDEDADIDDAGEAAAGPDDAERPSSEVAPAVGPGASAARDAAPALRETASDLGEAASGLRETASDLGEAASDVGEAASGLGETDEAASDDDVLDATPERPVDVAPERPVDAVPEPSVPSIEASFTEPPAAAVLEPVPGEDDALPTGSSPEDAEGTTHQPETASGEADDDGRPAAFRSPFG
ncbi:tetratricopeptide repeat protein [Motilibacter deserti]|uniref:Tetratricopeptide repeat protein n=1 Tax=Motilibacter deserti TaxID=2714956 RepID=A0ABX0GTW1_9ACTN|nr:hypothetical protein [Motilibacter deserti]NHC14227.1 hypothetical protein [Motilibacter deserti]